MNKLLVITGGTKGIGRALVEKFAAHNFTIVTCARTEESLKRLKTELKEQFKDSELHTFRADLAVKEEVIAFGRFINNLNRSVDVLIHNTGVYTPGQIHTEEEGVIEKMITTNLYSAYHLTRILVPDMIKRKSGSIFTICSTASIIPYVNGGSYCISKHALLGMTKVLREELKPYNIKVTAVLPGATKTASWDGVDLPEERFMQPKDIAESVYGIYNLSPNTVIEEILLRPQLGDI